MTTRGDVAGQGPNGDLDDDTALERAIALSLQHEETTVTSPKKSATTSKGLTKTSNFGSLALDRKQMEEERLARSKKRSAAIAGFTEVPLSLKRVAPANKSDQGTAAKPSNRCVAQPPSSSTNGLRFATGAVKKTWAFGCTRTADDIKFEEVVEKENLEMAIVSSFQWDEEWLLSKIDPMRTKLLLIAYANNEAEKKAMQSNVPSSRIRFCFPPMHAGGYLHSKLFLLKFKGHIRIVVSSANLVPYDWGETGEIENMLFLIDLPLVGNVGESCPARAAQTSFGGELQKFLRAQNLDEDLVGSLDKYDFSETRRYGFVHTIAGSHTGAAKHDTGYCGLAKAVNLLDLGTTEPISIDYVSSSLGSLDHSFLKAIYHACQGDPGTKEYQERQVSVRRGKNATSTVPQLDTGRGTTAYDNHFRIYFPSEQTVTGSRGGKRAAGTICMQDKWWRSSSFPRETLRDSISVREGLLMHHKLLFVKPSDKTRGRPAWAYVGSANLSESAWGRLVKDRASGQPKLNCRNWECGVLVPISEADLPKQPDICSNSGQDVFNGIIPIPLQFSTAAYGALSGDTASSRPWFFHRHT